MTIQEALDELFNSGEFKDAARNDAKLRVYEGRIKKEGVKSNTAIDLLTKFGYKIEVLKEE